MSDKTLIKGGTVVTAEGEFRWDVLCDAASGTIAAIGEDVAEMPAAGGARVIDAGGAYVILGPIAEANFIQGSMIADATNGRSDYFLTGGLNLFLIAVVLASIAYSVWMELRHRRYTSKEDVLS